MRSSFKISTTSSIPEKFRTCGKSKKDKISSIALALSMQFWSDLNHLKPFIEPLLREWGKDCMWYCQWVRSVMLWGSDAENSQLWLTAAPSTGFSHGPKKRSWVLQLPSWKNMISSHLIKISQREAILSKRSQTSAKRFTSQPTNRPRNSKPHSRGRFTQHPNLIWICLNYI